MCKYWQVLLTRWREEKKNGLTIPFLIGAQSYFSSEKKKRHTIASLITDMANSKDYETYITYCTDINQLIIGARTGEKLALGGAFMKFTKVVESNFFLTGLMELGSTLNEVVASLTERHQNNLDRQQYSINDGEWGGFSEKEIVFIQECAKFYQSPNSA